VTAFARARADAALETLGLTAAYLAAMRLVVRPLAGHFARRCEPGGLTRGSLVVVTLALLTSALCTEAIGIHALFGAFLLGALVPRGSRLARELRARFEDLVLVVLLPAFFAITGLRTEIGLVQGAADWLACGLIVATASVGKVGGAYIGARVTGLGPRESASLGVLLNTRGLMELVVLVVGLELGVLSPRLYTMMVIMALVTTFATVPLLRVLRRAQA
jgi:Kef-type K+ transport system membrane component KefB